MDVDRSKLTVEQLAALEQHEFATKQVKRLTDIQAVLEEVAESLIGSGDKSETNAEKFGAILVDIRETLKSLNDKEAPETPDYAKPVVETLKNLEKALTTSIKSIDTKPQVNVAAPNVETKVDLKGVEKVLKDIPSAFEKAIKLIPEVKIPKGKDYSDEFKDILSMLQSIDTASRMKPQNVGALIINESSNPVPVTDGSPVSGVTWDYIEVTATSGTVDTLQYKTGGTGGSIVKTLTITYTSSGVEKISDTFDKLSYS